MDVGGKSVRCLSVGCWSGVVFVVLVRQVLVRWSVPGVGRVLVRVGWVLVGLWGSVSVGCCCVCECWWGWCGCLYVLV